LIIVIGGIKFLQVSGSTEGHVDSGEPGGPTSPSAVAEEQKESQVNHG
jgi:hypothetical protein